MHIAMTHTRGALTLSRWPAPLHPCPAPDDYSIQASGCVCPPSPPSFPPIPSLPAPGYCIQVNGIAVYLRHERNEVDRLLAAGEQPED